MTTKPMTLRPGLLVALRVTVDGGVEYQRVEEKVKNADGTETAEWKMIRIIQNKDEYDRARKAGASTRRTVASVCTVGSFGYLCPVSREKELDQAYEQAFDIARAFNQSAETTQVSVTMIKGRIESSDELAVQTISAEVRGLLDTMKSGIATANRKMILDAAADARKLGQMLDEGTTIKITKAIEEARSAAKAIARRVEKDGEDATLVIQELSRKAIDEARFAFVDMSEDVAPEVVSSQPARSVEIEEYEQRTPDPLEARDYFPKRSEVA